MANGQPVPENAPDDYRFPDWVFPIEELKSALSQNGFHDVRQQGDHRQSHTFELTMTTDNGALTVDGFRSQLARLVEAVDPSEGSPWRLELSTVVIQNQTVTVAFRVRRA